MHTSYENPEEGYILGSRSNAPVFITTMMTYTDYAALL